MSIAGYISLGVLLCLTAQVWWASVKACRLADGGTGAILIANLKEGSNVTVRFSNGDVRSFRLEGGKWRGQE
jgi:hypothetical protein